MKMSAPRLISPILDGYELGKPLSRHSAVQCCVATEKISGDPFIVKMISVPQSGVHVDALLMAGAFSDRTGANGYYKERARAILNEAKTLRYMAALSNFADFDSVQVIPAEEENGFEVYLLAPYRLSFQDMLHREELSQLEVLNMALDICAALTACRHAGFFYANLKPGNIFSVGQHYRIGDLGFVPLSTVNNAPLSEHLRSNYTPPELLVGKTPLNSTADVYALGLILYEAYNGGVLPEENDKFGKLFAPPRYADYELAEIILRACALDPSIRWNSPEQMGQALARYLHRNGIRNTPIIPSALKQISRYVPAQVEDFLPEAEDDFESDEPMWDTDAPTSKNEASPENGKVSTRYPVGLFVAAALALLLLVELGIGAWVLLSR